MTVVMLYCLKQWLLSSYCLFPQLSLVSSSSFEHQLLMNSIGCCGLYTFFQLFCSYIWYYDLLHVKFPSFYPVQWRCCVKYELLEGVLHMCISMIGGQISFIQSSCQNLHEILVQYESLKVGLRRLQVKLVGFTADCFLDCCAHA